MATQDTGSDGVRLQAERVLRAYKALREAPKNSDPRDDVFPIGLFAELVQQIKQLEGWLEPAESADQTANRINRIAAVRDLTGEEARERLYAETVREIQAEYPDISREQIAACLEYARELSESEIVST